MFYLSLLFLVTLRMENKLVRTILIGLFLYRLAGFFLFEITHIRLLLFLFPNIFENYFFFTYIVNTVARHEPKIPYPMIMLVLVLLTIPKMFHEYSIHIIEKPLTFELFNHSYRYDGAIHQPIFIIGLALLFGCLYRKR